ncbi:hypothetical protein HMPREF1544_08214, partial [Mucor circinelloides 1006PhL]
QDKTLRLWPHAPKKIFQGIHRSGDLQLQCFFQLLCLPSVLSGQPKGPPPMVSFSPFVQKLEVFQGGDIVSKTSTNTFRLACASFSSVPTCLSSITVNHRLLFWILHLLIAAQKNVVYRFINNCI